MIFKSVTSKKSFRFVSLIVVASMVDNWAVKAMEEKDERHQAASSQKYSDALKSLGEKQTDIGGQLYNCGKFHEALLWFKKGAKNGDPLAKEFYFNTIAFIGIRHSQKGEYSEAFRILRPLAEIILPEARHGASCAQHTLGVMFANGEGVIHSYPIGLMWFRRAAALGHKGAKRDVKGIKRNMLGVEVTEITKYLRRVRFSKYRWRPKNKSIL